MLWISLEEDVCLSCPNTLSGGWFEMLKNLQESQQLDGSSHITFSTHIVMLTINLKKLKKTQIVVSIVLDHTVYFHKPSLVNLCQYIYVFLSIHWMAVLILEQCTWHSMSHLALGNSLAQSVLSLGGPRSAFIYRLHLQTPYDFMQKIPREIQWK